MKRKLNFVVDEKSLGVDLDYEPRVHAYSYAWVRDGMVQIVRETGCDLPTKVTINVARYGAWHFGTYGHGATESDALDAAEKRMRELCVDAWAFYADAVLVPEVAA